MMHGMGILTRPLAAYLDRADVIQVAPFPGILRHGYVSDGDNLTG
jgi:hypothetical protein